MGAFEDVMHQRCDRGNLLTRHAHVSQSLRKLELSDEARHPIRAFTGGIC